MLENEFHNVSDEAPLELRKDHVSLNRGFILSLLIGVIFMVMMTYIHITDIRELRAEQAELIQKLEVSSLKIWGLERELKLSSPAVCLRRFDEKVRDFRFGKPVTADMLIEDAACALSAGVTDERIGFLVDHLVAHESELFKDYPFYKDLKEGKKEVVKIELISLIHSRVNYH